jgi:hypothetical protein
MSIYLPRRFHRLLILLPALFPLFFMAGVKAFNNHSSAAVNGLPRAYDRPSSLSMTDSHVWVDIIWCYDPTTQQSIATTGYLDGGDGFHQGYNFGYSGTNVTYSFTGPVTRAGFTLMGQAGQQVIATPNNGPPITKTLEPWEIFGNPQTPKADFDFFGGGITSITIVSLDPQVPFFFGNIGFDPCVAPPPPTPSPTPPPSPTPTPTATPTPVPEDDIMVAPFPYPSPIETDTSFYAPPPDGATTHTVSRSGGPITMKVAVKRVVGDLNSDGTLKYPSELVANGVVSRFAKLRIPAYDVDYNQGERDHVLFNGVEIGPLGFPAYLTGNNKEWSVSEYQIPIELVHFGKRNPGSTPTPGQNEVKVFVDEGSPPDGIERWRVAVAGAKIQFKALAPVVMVHGNNSCGDFFAGHWNCKPDPEDPTDPRFIQPFIDQKIPFDNSINMPTDRIEVHAAYLLNGGPLNKSIKAISAEWGAKHVNIIAHSKGGIDVREFLTRLAAGNHPPDLGVYSFTTLSSPHLGTVGADYQVAAEQLTLKGIGLSDKPLRALLGVALKPDAGSRDLTVAKMDGFNHRNLGRLPTTFTVDGENNNLDYYAISADANIDNSQENGSVLEKFHPEKFLPTITISNPDETRGLPYIPILQNFTLIGKPELYTDIYRTLGTVHRVQLVDRAVPFTLVPTTTKAIKEIHEPCWFLHNDFIVTWASAIARKDTCDATPGFGNALNSRLPLRDGGSVFANHATMSTASTANTVINWIRQSQPMQ